MFGRPYRGPYSDKTIYSASGKFGRLVVQATDEVRAGRGGSTWERVEVDGIGPRALRLANWTMRHLQDFHKPLREQTRSEIARSIGNSLLVSIPMIFLVREFQPPPVPLLQPSDSCLQVAASVPLSTQPGVRSETDGDTTRSLTGTSGEQRRVATLRMTQ